MQQMFRFERRLHEEDSCNSFYQDDFFINALLYLSPF